MQRDHYIAAFMQAPDMRREFPDPGQRRAVAEVHFEQGLPARSRFDELVDCCKGVGDIPAVQTIINLLSPGLEDWWAEIMGQTVNDAVARLMELEDRIPGSRPDGLMFSARPNRDEDVLLLALFSVLTRGSQAPLPARMDALVSRATTRLLLDGGASVGSLDLSTEPLLRNAAKDDLRAMLAGRISRREQEIKDVIRDFLRNARARTPLRPGDIPGGLGEGAGSLQEWLAGLTATAGLETSQWLPQVVDLWSYRWFNVGAFRAARQRGVTDFVAFAIRDQRTTPFCIWVHGRVVSTTRMQNQLDQHVRLSAEGDIEGMIRNWPMLPNEIIRGSSARDFRRGFARVGIPPYHFGCRTRIRPA